MPKKAKNETQGEQGARFRAEVERMIAAGELNPTEADKRLDGLTRKVKTTSPPTGGGEG